MELGCLQRTNDKINEIHVVDVDLPEIMKFYLLSLIIVFAYKIYKTFA